MQAGDLNRRISIRRAIEQLDDWGKPMASGEAELLKVWAMYRPISDKERLTHKNQVNLTARFTIRWSPPAALITAQDKIIFEGRHYGICGVKEIGRRQYLEITAGAHET